ncbi:RNase_H domain-containing protein [Cephalotus follicularis]|uniref:RNase_H domain-containing protein n=1 Tax=Cephalotus follicularis TaxID=3775 RepID=A0A1Q3AVH5_CEPFO|nr:RNase_H domain-containing protein [Cephalotus follicularis]
MVSWLRPPISFYKLNTDGFSRGNPGPSGAGGVIRDEVGNWVRGFSSFIGRCTSIQTELWGLREGLKLAWKIMHIEKLNVETDSQLSMRILHFILLATSLRIVDIFSINYGTVPLNISIVRATNVQII